MLQGIPFWDAIAAELAVYWVPQGIRNSQNKIAPLRSLLRWATAVRQGLPKRAFQPDSFARPSWPSSPVVLYLGFSPYMVRDVLQPLLCDSAWHGDVATVCLVTEGRGEFGAGVFRSVWADWNESSRSLADRLAEELKEVASRILQERAINALLSGVPTASKAAMRGVLRSLLRERLVYLLPYAALAKRVLAEHRPSVVVSSDVADALARLYLGLARTAGIPSLELQFGIYGDEAVEWGFSLSDWIAVWGDAPGRIIESHGVAASRVKVTGSPRHDVTLAGVSKDISIVRRDCDLPVDQRIVLFASTVWIRPYGGGEEAAALAATQRAIFEEADRAEDWLLVVKPHPLENPEQTKRLARHYKHIRWTDRRADIRHLILACDVFVSAGSTATMDALISHRVCIDASFPGWPFGDLFAKSGAVLVARSPQELSLQLSRALRSPEETLARLEPARSALLASWTAGPDGKAAERINALTRQLAGL